MEEYWCRTSLLLGTSGIAKLKQSSLLIVGLGGVGSYATEAIARCGVGHISIIDPDIIAGSNINRQLPALSSTLGQYKTEVMGRRILDINPSVNLQILTMAYHSDNSKEIFQHSFDYVIDAIDSLPDKIHLIKTCLTRNIPIISSMGTANHLDPLQLQVADISETSICPVARKVRKGLRQENISGGVKVVYSRETPCQVPAGADTRLGSVSFVPGAAGLIMASVAIRDIVENSE